MKEGVGLDFIHGENCMIFTTKPNQLNSVCIIDRYFAVYYSEAAFKQSAL